MSDEKKPEEKPEPYRETEEDVALSVSEDKRLVRMGIDPDGDPIEIMRKVDERLKYLEENPDAS